MKTLIEIDGHDAIVLSDFKPVTKADENGMLKAKMIVQSIYCFEPEYDSHRNHIGIKKTHFSKSLILQLYNAVIEAESADEVDMKGSDIDDDLPW